MNAPRFVIVGHPNKGKSSIVATLAQDEHVRIAAEPGTTTRADAYPMRLDGRVLYILVDTPGFQRARGALAWMREHETDAAAHPDVVRRFVEEPDHAERFPDEVALLRPLIDADGDDTGVLYVVDGSTPFGPEYEPEMEILRWAGRPRMALINPIGDADHLDQWRAALGQYFGVVRVFNAVTAEWQKRIELLQAFGQLNERWQAPLGEAIAALEADRSARRSRTAELVAAAVVEAMRFRVEKKLSNTEDPAAHREELETRYRDGLRAIERRCRDRVEEAYDFVDLRRSEDETRGVDEALGDLFAQGTWNRTGLSRAQLVAAGATGGAGSGVILDAIAHGTSLGAFLVGGAVIGGLGAWWGGGQLPKSKLMGLPLGGRLAAVGPCRTINLGFVLMGRARVHHRLIAQRTHARRDVLDLAASTPIEWEGPSRSHLSAPLQAVMKHPEDDVVAADAQRTLAAALADLFARDVDAA